MVTTVAETQSEYQEQINKLIKQLPHQIDKSHKSQILLD